MRPLIALAVMLAIGTAGCGKRGDPLPPLQRIPTAVNRPRVSQQGQEIVIVWEAPSGTVDGGALELSGAEVLRRIVEPPPELPPEPTLLPAEAGTETSAAEPAPSVLPAVEGVEGEPGPEAVSETVGRDAARAESSQEMQTETPEETTEQTEPADPIEEAEPVAPRFALAAPRQASFASEAEVIARIESTQPGERLEYRDTWDPEWKGMRVEYAVRHLNSKGRLSENSDRSSIEPLPPIPAPSGLEAVTENGLVRLTWNDEPLPTEPDAPGAEDTPETSDEEEELHFGFNVYRRGKGAEPYPAEALNRRLLETTRFDDRSVAFRREWCYTVRRVAVRPTPEPSEAEPATDENVSFPGESASAAEEPAAENARGRRGRAARRASGDRGRQAQQAPEPPAVIESAGSTEVCLTPIDTFAPEVPDGVVAIGVPGGILLSWRESVASDLEGYRIYRAEQENGPFELLTPELVDVSSFTDRGLTPGKPYFYTVSAVDGAEPPNESARSAVVTAQAPE